MTPAAQGSTIVRLHHRRCGWTWVAVCSLIGLVVYVAVGAHLFDNLSGTSELLSMIPGFVLLALVLTGLIVAIVDTVRLRRADAAVRATARANVSHCPCPSMPAVIRPGTLAAGCSAGCRSGHGNRPEPDIRQRDPIAMIIVGLFFEGMAVLLVFVLLAVLGRVPWIMGRDRVARC